MTFFSHLFSNAWNVGDVAASLGNSVGQTSNNRKYSSLHFLSAFIAWLQHEPANGAELNEIFAYWKISKWKIENAGDLLVNDSGMKIPVCWMEN